MTIANPPYVLSASSHGAQLFREAISSLLSPAGGTVQPEDLQLTQNGTPNMSVNVGAGRIWIPGTTLPSVNPGGGAYYPQGLYYTENDAAVNLAISASNPTNPRIDTIICQIEDAFYAGASNLAQLAVVTGTPTAGATLANLNGAGAVPASSLVLGYVLVPANATTIVTADISNTAVGLPGAGAGVAIATSQALTSTSYATLATPDEITVTMAADGLILVWYQATWQNSAQGSGGAGAGRAAIFLGSHQLEIAGASGPITEAATGPNTNAANAPLASFPLGLYGTVASGYTGDLTTGQAVGAWDTNDPVIELGGAPTSLTNLGFVGGPCSIFAAAGNYVVSVQFKSASGSVTVKNRQLWVQTLA